MPSVCRIAVRGTPHVLASRARWARSVAQRLVGLIGCTRLEPGQGLIIPACRSIHTCFMRIPIDAVFVDQSWRVVKLYRQLVPWRLSATVWEAWAVVELPAGRLDQVPLKVGDQLLVETLKFT